MTHDQALDDKHSLWCDTGHTVKSLLAMPFNVFLLDTDSKSIKVNEEVASTLGFTSIKAAIGTSVFDVADHPTDAAKVRQNDIEILQRKRIHLFDEEVLHKNDLLNFISIKAPILNSDSHVLGIFGCSILIGHQPIAKSLMTLTDLGLLNIKDTNVENNLAQGMKVDNTFITKKEVAVLQYMIRGKTAKQIASILHLSHRTIEHRIENIKNKFGVKSRSELIDIAIAKFI